MVRYKRGELGYLVPQSERIKANGKGPSYKPISGGPFIVLGESELIEMLREAFIGRSHGYIFEEFLLSKNL